MKMIRVAFLVCALMALVLCVTPANALAHDLAFTEEGVPSVEESLDLEEGDARDDAQSGDRQPGFSVFSGKCEGSLRFGNAVGGAEIKPSISFDYKQRIDQGALASSRIGAGAALDEKLDERYAAEKGNLVVKTPLFALDARPSGSISVNGQSNTEVKRLLGDNLAKWVSGDVRLYAYPINDAGYECLASAS